MKTIVNVFECIYQWSLSILDFLPSIYLEQSQSICIKFQVAA